MTSEGVDPSPSSRVVAVCGFQNSGKTTLLEGAIQQLRRLGLLVAVVKHDAHGLSLDVDGKDSDRLFRAGADVWVGGPGESFGRTRPEALGELLARLERRYDLVIVEGHKRTPLPKVWLEGPDGETAPAELDNVIAAFPWEGDRVAHFVGLACDRLAASWAQQRRLGGVLDGGSSRRMGRPKGDLEYRGRTFLENVAAALESSVDEVVVLGGTRGGRTRLPDAGGVAGPLAGLLAAVRWAPEATWIVAASDQPLITPAALSWLLEQRRPGRWAVIPRLRDGRLQPLLALYEPLAGSLLEAIARRGEGAPTAVAEHPQVVSPSPPAAIEKAWTNVNTPAELDRLEG